MWTLLKELVQLNFKSSYISKSAKNLAASHLEKADIQSLLYQMGYRCLSFYDDDDVGSRDILVAIGWLLAKLDFVNEQVKVKLEDASPPLSTFHLGAVQKTLSSGVTKASTQVRMRSLTIISTLKKIFQLKFIMVCHWQD